MWSEGHMKSFCQCCNLLHLRDATGVTAVWLQDVDRVFGQVGNDTPDRAVALTESQRNSDLLLESFEDFDVSRYGRLFEKENV